MQEQRRTILFVMQRAPYGNSQTRDMIDAILAAAAFNHNVQLLFTGEGLWQLLPEQRGQSVAMKGIDKLLSALPYYDIHALFVDQYSLHSRHLQADQLLLPVVPLNAVQLRQLMRDADSVVTL